MLYQTFQKSKSIQLGLLALSDVSFSTQPPFLLSSISCTGILIFVEMGAKSCPRDKFLNITVEFHCLQQDMQGTPLCRSDLVKDTILTSCWSIKLYQSRVIHILCTYHLFIHATKKCISIKLFCFQPALEHSVSSSPRTVIPHATYWC